MSKIISRAPADPRSTSNMIFQLCVVVLGTEVTPLLAGCTGHGNYWDEDDDSCNDYCLSGFYQVKGEVNVCSTCDSATKFVTGENYFEVRECRDTCPDSAFADINISNVKYRQCVKTSSCDSYVREETIIDGETLLYAHCMESCPEGLPTKVYGECMTCDVAKDDPNSYWDGEQCVSCSHENPHNPVRYNDACVTCEEAYPELPYWNTTACVAEIPRKSLYTASVVLILLAFVGISVLKFWQFMVHPGEKSEKFKPHGIIATVLTFLCVAAIAALGCIIAFTKTNNK